MTKFNSECPSSPARAWEGRNGKGPKPFPKRNETKRKTQIQCRIGTESVALHPEYCRQRRPFAPDPKSNPPLSCSLDLAKPQGPVPCSPFYTAHQPPLSICSAVRNGIATYAGVHGTYASLLHIVCLLHCRKYPYMSTCFVLH